jgi:hypothetical protein
LAGDVVANVNRAWENWCRMVDRPYRE